MADRIAVLLALALTLSPGPAGYARAPREASGTMNLDLRSRDLATGEPRIDRVAIDPGKVGVVVVDMWNWHWCKTAAARVGALVPRMDRVLDAARELGMT